MRQTRVNASITKYNEWTPMKCYQCSNHVGDESPTLRPSAPPAPPVTPLYHDYTNCLLHIVLCGLSTNRENSWRCY